VKNFKFRGPPLWLGRSRLFHRLARVGEIIKILPAAAAVLALIFLSSCTGTTVAATGVGFAVGLVAATVVVDELTVVEEGKNWPPEVKK